MKTLVVFLRIALFLIVVNGFSQKIGTPQLGFEYACVSHDYNNFEGTFTFEEKPFSADNVFYVELSDARGSFDKPTIVQTINDENYSFEFKTNFSLPENVAGEGYKIRLRSTSPAITGAATSVFDAYFVNREELILNNYSDVSLCGSGVSVISLNKDVAEEYVWYKNGALYALTDSNSLAISEPGEYYAEPYYGNCTGSNYSNLVIAKMAENFQVAITASSDNEDCTASIFTLSASIDNKNYQYAWFKNDKKIEGLSSYMPVLELPYETSNMGVYMVEVINEGGCKAVSNTQSLEQHKGMVVEVTSPLNAVIVGDNVATLSINTNADSGEITWYKDGQLLKEGYNSNSLLVTEQGDYYALVSSENQCQGATKSQTFKIYEPQSYTVSIAPDKDYVPCMTDSARLGINGIKGVLSNGDVITIAEEFYNNFQLQWVKDQQVVAEGSVLGLDFSKNGSYTLRLTYEGVTYDSNSLNLTLGLPEMHLVVDQELSCDVDKGILRVDRKIEGAKYNWYKNDKLIVTNDLNSLSVADGGSYHVEVAYGGCSLTTASVSLDRDAKDLVSLYPGEKATIGPNGVIQANATGAESYQWLSEEGDVLSEVSTLTINQGGVYTLLATVGSCTIEKSIEVNANLVEDIPNVVSPNNDTVNDKWTLPQKLISDPETEVIICDAYGSTVLKTTSYDNSWPDSTTKFSSETPVFYYFINKKGKNVKKGSITLVN